MPEVILEGKERHALESDGQKVSERVWGLRHSSIDGYLCVVKTILLSPNTLR